MLRANVRMDCFQVNAVIAGAKIMLQKIVHTEYFQVNVVAVVVKIMLLKIVHKVGFHLILHFSLAKKHLQVT